MIRATAARVTVLQITAAVARHYELDVPLLLSKRRHSRIVRPRWIAMYLARQMTGQSLPQISRALRLHHTTVMHGIRIVENTPEMLREANAIATTRLERRHDASERP